jgi:general stress protein 26
MLTFDPRAASLLSEQGLGVLSTIGRDGIVHGAVIHCLLKDDSSIYFMTKSQTQKIHDTLANPRVALTVYDHEKMQTAQIQGIAQIEADQTIKNYVFSHLSKARQYGSSKHLPPVTQLKQGGFIIIKITPTTVKYSNYK